MDDDERSDRNQIDLTVQQEAANKERVTKVDEDLDLLDRYIDPFDVEAIERRNQLQSEIEHEKTKIRAKYLFRYGLQEGDPFKVFQ